MVNNTSCRINTIEMLYASWRSGGFGGWPAHLNMKLRKRKVFRITHSVEFKQRSMKFAYPIPVPLFIAISVLVTVYCQCIEVQYLSLELRRLCLILFRSGAIIVPYLQHFQSSGSSIVSWFKVCWVSHNTGSAIYLLVLLYHYTFRDLSKVIMI